MIVCRRKMRHKSPTWTQHIWHSVRWQCWIS